MNNSIKFIGGLLFLSFSSFAFSQESPSFDCTLAKTHVEKVLCSGGNSGMGDLDQTMHDLYQALRKTPGMDEKTLSTSQRKWLEKRNLCTGTDDEVMNCLYDSYRERYKELSKNYDKEQLTGLFTNKLGTLDSVLFPDGKLSVNISTDSGAPSYDSCTVSFRAPVEDNIVRHVLTKDEIVGDYKCSIDMKVSGTQMKISSKECRASLCGNSAIFDGTYKKQ
ncbi:hypothetical protein N5C39_23870 [Enterobacter bugandensis]|uniref:DUF1311 domain-containing protein n=1 Tax=Enterobacter bugandensis TaxID=881260 RepID=A0AA42PZT1_9ENTR|nr:hypothetical protein [Enterobacter bugandensis]MDH1321412.1 hypothetical protein [Enterobacter bugandensis]